MNNSSSSNQMLDKGWPVVVCQGKSHHTFTKMLCFRLKQGWQPVSQSIKTYKSHVRAAEESGPPVCRTLSAVWRSGVWQRWARSEGRKDTYSISSHVLLWLCAPACTCSASGAVMWSIIPVHHKSYSWPDRAVCSSWRWLQCPPQTLPVESGSAFKTHKPLLKAASPQR